MKSFLIAVVVASATIAVVPTARANAATGAPAGAPLWLQYNEQGAVYLRCTETDSLGRIRTDVRVSTVSEFDRAFDRARVEIRTPGRAKWAVGASVTAREFNVRGSDQKGVQLQYWLEDSDEGYLLVNTLDNQAGRGFLMPSTAVESQGIPLECQFQ